MKNEISNQQALIELYNASKLASLPADQHTYLLECAKVLETFITPKPEKEEKTKK